MLNGGRGIRHISQDRDSFSTAFNRPHRRSAGTFKEVHRICTLLRACSFDEADTELALEFLGIKSRTHGRHALAQFHVAVHITAAHNDFHLTAIERRRQHEAMDMRSDIVS